MFIFEEWLKKNSYWEDPDAMLMIQPLDENGGVSISDNEYTITGEGRTLEEACLNFEAKVLKKYGHLRYSEED